MAKKPMPKPKAKTPPPPEEEDPQQQSVPGMGAGMMSGGDDEGGEQQPDAEAPEGEQDSGGRQQASPEEQAMLDKFMNNAFNLMYTPDGKVNDTLQKALDGKDPVMALASSTTTLVSALNKSAAGAGQKLPADVLLNGGAQILQELADLSEKLGIHKYTPDEMKSAAMKATDMYLRLNPPDEQQQAIAKQDMQSMIEADKQGNIEEVLPGITDAAKQMAPPTKGGK